MIQNILVVLATFIIMELVAWLAHKFVMHGFLSKRAWFFRKK